jgi:predicted nucleic acid-binding protein
VALLIDTDLLIDFERGAGNPEVEEHLGDEDRAISVITVSELLHGAATALAHGLGVATRNASDFERVTGLRVVTAAA